jgi:hypothetical protein
MGQTPSDRLDTVADVAAAIEAAGNEITDLRVTVDDDCGHGTAHVSLPIIDEHGESSCEFDLVTATLDDGTLRIELDVATETPETTSDEPAPPAAVTAETPDEDGADRPVGDEQSTPADEDSSSERDATGSAATDSSAESAAGEDSAAALDSPDSEGTERSAESAPSEAAADSDAPASDGPPAYRDPDRLAAVYDPEATFPEMTDALGVDVTPQTVRKYMIEHGIHEPASRASDTLAQANTDADEETGVEETESERDAETTERNAETTEPEAGEAHQTSAEATPADEERSQRSSDGVEIVDGDESAASDASDRADTTTESVASDADSAAGDATADDDTAAATTQPTTETNGDETDDATTDPPGESTADTTTTTSTATDGGTQPTRSAVESLELPDEVSVAELVSVLTDSRTVYEVRRGLGIDDSRTRAILRQYDLIDLVTGRITQGSEPPDRQEVLSRLSEASDRGS